MQKKFRPQKIIVKGITPETIFDYKDIALISQFLTSRGKIAGRARSSLTSKQQRQLTAAVKRARVLAMLPFAS